MNIDSTKAYAIFLAVLPILNIYVILPFPIIYVFFYIGMILFLIKLEKNGRDGKVQIPCLLFLLYGVISILLEPVLYNVNIYAAIVRLAYFSMSYIVFYIASYRLINSDYLCKAYLSVSLLVCVPMLMQYVASQMGYPFTLIIPNLVTNTGDSLLSNVYIDSQLASGRYSSLFLEPAHFAQYVLPCLALVLFKPCFERREHTVLCALLLTIAIVLSTSMQGIVCSGIVWILYCVSILKRGRIESKGPIIICAIVLIIIGFYIISQPSIVEQFSKKASSLFSIFEGNIHPNSSLYLRFFVGWSCYFDFDLVHKLFGCGYGNAGSYISQIGIAPVYYTDVSQVGYMSGMSKLFVEFGLVGALVYLAFIVTATIKYRDPLINALLAVWVFIMLTSNSFDTLSTLLPIAMILCRANSLARTQADCYAPDNKLAQSENSS